MAVGYRSASYSPVTGNGDAAASVTVSTPVGTQAGDMLVAICARSQTGASAYAFAASGWASGGFFAGNSSLGPVGLLFRQAVAGEPSAHTFTSPGRTGADQFVVHILALTGVHPTSPLLVAPTIVNGGTSTRNVTTASVTLPEPGMLVTWHSALDFASGTSFTGPSGMAERVDRGGEWLHAATYTESRTAAGVTGTRTAVYSAQPQLSTRAVAFVVRQASAPIELVGIPSTLQVGYPALLGTIQVVPASISSTLTLGTLELSYGKIRPPGIPSSLVMGRPTLRPGPVTLGPLPGIGPRVSLGYPRLRTSVIVTGQPGAVRRGVTYELVMVARVPSSSGPPTLLELDAIPTKGLAWAEELSKPQRLDVATSQRELSPSILSRLEDPFGLPSELRLYRGSTLVFAGPLINWQRQGEESISIYGLGLLAYMRYARVRSDLVFKQVDQFAIVKALVDHAQGDEYGNYGIDTSQVGMSGILRDATYVSKEDHNIGQRIEELGTRINGFDLDVDPLTRRLNLFYPIKGVDRSSSEDAIVFDQSNITSGDVAASVAPGDIATDAFGTGTGDSAISSERSNPDLRSRFGRVDVAASFDGVSEQSTLDEHTQALLDARSSALIVPGPDVRVTPDVDPTTYSVGDTVSYVLSDRLGVSGAFRLRKRTIKVTERGRETASFEFA